MLQPTNTTVTHGPDSLKLQRPHMKRIRTHLRSRIIGSLSKYHGHQAEDTQDLPTTNSAHHRAVPQPRGTNAGYYKYHVMSNGNLLSTKAWACWSRRILSTKTAQSHRSITRPNIHSTFQSILQSIKLFSINQLSHLLSNKSFTIILNSYKQLSQLQLPKYSTNQSIVSKFTINTVYSVLST
jgi:hypothetical protein